MRTADAIFGRYCNPDSEAAEFIVRCDVSRLWDAYVRGEDVDAILEAEGDYARTVRGRFIEELEGVKALPVPEGWAFRVNGKLAKPLPMQMRCAYEVLHKRRVGNWSGTGAGKTGSALISSRVIDARVTLIIAANATIESVWVKEISEMFTDSVIHMGVPSAVDRERYNYVLLNYEKFQLLTSRTTVERIAGLGVDFVVLDEVQKAKQRGSEASKRRRNLEGLVAVLSEQNPELCVLGMSATPVINNLTEAVKLLELITGHDHADLSTVVTVQNAMAVRRALMLNGFRYRPDYETKVHEERIPVDGDGLLEDLKAAKTPLAFEQALLPAKLPVAAEVAKKGTLIYSHYVTSIVAPTREYFEDLGYRVGIYTGDDKSGLKGFLKGKVDILVGSDPVGTGLDGLQEVCDRIVPLTLPWTAAEYKQLEGRIVREGGVFSDVHVSIPQVILNLDGNEWSWDKSRMAIIEHKRTLADCAVDGRIPDSVAISQGNLFRRDKGYLDAWATRLREEGPFELERAHLTIPLPPELAEKIRVRRGDFVKINNRWVSSNSSTVHERLKSDPSEWYLYHTLYRNARETWPELPVDHIAGQLKDRPDIKVGDFGCGENLLKAALPDHNVRGFDHVAIHETVTACDMSDTPLADGELGAVVFSLSLMGRNWPAYLDEAHRVLVPYGLLFVAEPAKKWDELDKVIEEHGFKVVDSYQRYDFRYVFGVKV